MLKTFRLISLSNESANVCEFSEAIREAIRRVAEDCEKAIQAVEG